MSNTSQGPHSKGKAPLEKKAKPIDLKDKYDTFFPIFSDEECKRVCSLNKKIMFMLKYFNDKILKEIRMHNYVNALCKKLGWHKLKIVQYDVFLELTIKFYTILKIKDEEQRIFSCRFFRKEYNFDYMNSWLKFLVFSKEVFVNLLPNST